MGISSPTSLSFRSKQTLVCKPDKGRVLQRVGQQGESLSSYWYVMAESWEEILMLLEMQSFLPVNNMYSENLHF